MLEQVKAMLAEGRRERAEAALREALVRVCVARFVSGWTGHPLLSPKSREFLDSLRGLDPGAFDEADLNLSLQRWIPDYALALDEALADAKHDLGAKASNLESEGPNYAGMLGWQAALVADVASEAMRAGASGRLDALERIRLADFDVPDDGSARAAGDDVLFRCEGCGTERREPIASAGDSTACACGNVADVPRLPLERMAGYLKAKRDALRGIGRCRVCKGIIQLGKAGFMAAGYCGAYCAKQAVELFREYVAREGTWDGERIAFGCVCGASLRAEASEVGAKRPCEACGIEVWIPNAAPTARKGVAPCAGCGRPRKASASRCMYCGRA